MDQEKFEKVQILRGPQKIFVIQLTRTPARYEVTAD